MDILKRYRIVILGALLLILVLMVGRSRKAPEPVAYSFKPPAGVGRAVPAAHAPDAAQSPAEQPSARGLSSPGLEGEPQGPVSRERGAEAEAGTEQAADTASVEDSGPDLEAARAEAVTEVRQFNEKLASTLWTFNPNARKTRLKAAELAGRAGHIEEWIRSQDDRTDWSPSQRQEWEAQRDIWVAHAQELKQVANRLSSTRGTRRKVRILAQEIKDKLTSVDDD